MDFFLNSIVIANIDGVRLESSDCIWLLCAVSY